MCREREKWSAGRSRRRGERLGRAQDEPKSALKRIRWKRRRIIREKSKAPPSKTEGRAPIYDGVGSVKRHEECASHGGSFSLHLKGTLLFLSSTKARFVNPAVESGSTNHLFGLP